MGYMIGIDGGATGTVAILTDKNGKMLHTASAAASNYIAVGKKAAQEALQAVIEDVISGAGVSKTDCEVAVIGLAGLNSTHDQQIYQSLVEPFGLSGDLHVENDIVIAWAAATVCQPGVVVIAGTGSSAFGVNAEGKRYKALGWDYILADQGSGYWIGLEGVRAAIKAWDGRTAYTPLLEAMIEQYELDSAEAMLAYAHSEAFDKPRIARFAKQVSTCAVDKNDPIAQEILRRAGEELAQGVVAVIKGLGLEGQAFTIGKVGGAFRSGDYLIEPFEAGVRAVAPDATIEFARYPSVIGAVIYAHYLAGSLDDAVIDELERTAVGALRWKT
jgi:glucosamine kinase